MSITTPTHSSFSPAQHLQWDNIKLSNRKLYAANKKDLLSFIIQAGTHYHLKLLITFEVLSLIDNFFLRGAHTKLRFNLKEMKMICLGCLSIRLKLNEYRALAASLINSLTLTNRRLAVSDDIGLYEIIVLREFNYDIIGMTNIGLTLFYSLIKVNNYFIRNINKAEENSNNECRVVLNTVSLFSNEVINTISSSLKKVFMLFNCKVNEAVYYFLKSIILVNYN